jgi:dihydrofolate reductase
MRAVTVSNIMSLDGFYEDSAHNPLVLNMDQAFDAYNLERIKAADLVLLGRTSFEGFSSYWPGSADAPADPDNRALTDDNRELSRIYNRLPEIVVGDSQTVPDDNAWRDTTTVISRSDAPRWVAAEREQGTGDILVFGSRTMWNGLLQQDLIDELHLMVSPIALGSGTPIIEAPVDLSLLEARRFDGSSNVLLRYAVLR